MEEKKSEDQEEQFRLERKKKLHEKQEVEGKKMNSDHGKHDESIKWRRNQNNQRSIGMKWNV